ncbi:MAG TPA: hypothetical protein VJ742_09315 [Nitrososphaera sp.]|nr:hypothetical protein [Nitrososphaera sp.]
MSVETFDISALEESYTERAVVNESNKKDTVYKGNYPVTIKKVSLQISPEDTKTAGRKVVNLQVSVPKSKDKSVIQFVRVSPDLYRKITIAGDTFSVNESHPLYDPSLPLDSQSKLWGQLEAIFNPLGKMSKADVVKSLPDSTLDAYILEGFAQEDGGMSFPEGDPKKDLKAYEASRNALLSQGMVAKNFFSSFKAIKE